MKIAVYSCNTGNYRNELSIKILNNIIFAEGIDYFLFTDKDVDYKITNHAILYCLKR